MNAFSVDVEEYFQVSAFAPHIPRADWEGWPSRVEEGTERILALLEEAAGSGGRPSVRRCPFCLGNLVRMGFGESPFIIIDRCGEHGLWLDKKELKKVVRSSRAQAAAMGLIRHFREEEDDEDE